MTIIYYIAAAFCIALVLGAIVGWAATRGGSDDEPMEMDHSPYEEDQRWPL